MYKSFWNFVGLAAGWLGGKRLTGDVVYSPSMDAGMGIAGTFIGGILICVSGISGNGRTVLATIVAMFSAVLLATWVCASSGRRAFARNG